tara:strand:- start:57 stop:221 length:165 start_codon:yes stop_codon:yes gene_type:complete
VPVEPAVVAEEALLPLLQLESQELLIQVVAVVEAMEMELDLAVVGVLVVQDLLF